MDHPSRRCFWSDWDLYCVSTRMRRSPECRQLLSVKSMMRYRPPKGTAGLARSAVNGCRREPIPPARITLITLSCMSPSIQFNGNSAGFRRVLPFQPDEVHVGFGMSLIRLELGGDHFILVVGKQPFGKIRNNGVFSIQVNAEQQDQT